MNLRKNNLILNHFLFRTFLCFLSITNFPSAFGQSNTVFDKISLLSKKTKAINSAKTYLDKRFPDKVISKHFIPDSIFSLLVYDDYKTFFSSNSVYCQPVGFEIAFCVVVNGGGSLDTLHSHLFLPIDSSFSVVANSLQDEWHHDFFEAWEKVISNKYKVNYSDVLQMAKEKNWHGYEIDFWFEKKGKHNFKFYWFVTEGSTLYRINPKSGAMKIRKLFPLKKLEDVS